MRQFFTPHFARRFCANWHVQKLEKMSQDIAAPSRPNPFSPVLSPARVHHNLSRAELFELSVQRSEGHVSRSGALVVETGIHSGRSPRDKFIVLDETTSDTIWWDNAQSMTPEQFDRLHRDFQAFAEDRELFIEDRFAGADEQHRVSVRVVCEFSWHALFAKHLTIRPSDQEYRDFQPELTVIDLPHFKADPERHGVRSETVIACDLRRQIVLICGTSYAGEIKKSIFSNLNYHLPAKGIMPMHCSVNEGKDGDAAVFFGLSGTGKTTLSADPERNLIGDDEHGWSPEGLFNFEGGCYAKTIRLTEESEPEIYSAVNHFGAILENVVLNGPNHEPDFDDGSLTENTRGAYPMEYFANSSKTGKAGHPKNIFMLTADAFGVLPPIAKLTPGEAMYHFLSGYTAKVAGTEKGVTEPQATFSACFGAPFMPRHPGEYGDLLRQLILEHDVNCWLINSGWTGGPHGVGHRIPLKDTRALVNAALSGEIDNVATRRDPIFNLSVPISISGIDDKLLSPRDSWADSGAYDKQAHALAKMFNENFAKLAECVDDEVKDSGPKIAA